MELKQIEVGELVTSYIELLVLVEKVYKSKERVVVKEVGKVDSVKVVEDDIARLKRFVKQYCEENKRDLNSKIGSNIGKDLCKQKMEAMGIPEGIVPEGWWVGFKIDDAEAYQKVKSGVYKMLSIEGSGQRVPEEVE